MLDKRRTESTWKEIVRLPCAAGLQAKRACCSPFVYHRSVLAMTHQLMIWCCIDPLRSVLPDESKSLGSIL
jgi:hypothetical protein